MKTFTQLAESKVPGIDGGYSYFDSAHPQHKASKAAAYEANEALKRRGIKVHDHHEFIKAMHKLLQQHTDISKL